MDLWEMLAAGGGGGWEGGQIGPFSWPGLSPVGGSLGYCLLPFSLGHLLGSGQRKPAGAAFKNSHGRGKKKLLALSGPTSQPWQEHCCKPRKSAQEVPPLAWAWEPANLESFASVNPAPDP